MDEYSDETKKPYEQLSQRQLDRLGSVDNLSLRERMAQDMLHDNKRVYDLPDDERF